LNNEHFGSKVGLVAPEFLLWATTGAGVNSVRRSYEVLETYGDTILKLAATLIAYCIKKEDKKAGEGDIENSKVIYVTNFHVFRVGYHVLKMHRFMRIMRDPEPKEWQLPLQGYQPRLNQCPGKSLADSVEAMIGAHFLTNDDIAATLQWISDIKLVPLE
jgi:dsRNA-specific ribonuclease